MTALPPPFPLAWPDGQSRTRNRERSQFRTTMDGAIKNVQGSLRLFAADSGKAMGAIEVTSNASMFSGPNVADPGVAVWFLWDGAMRCIAVDRYQTVAENLQAIHHVLEARRVELRHAGIEMARTAFKGFLALPPPPDRKPWHQVLGVTTTASPEDISAARKRLARELSGNDIAMSEVNVAHDQGMKERSMTALAALVAFPAFAGGPSLEQPDDPVVTRDRNDALLIGLVGLAVALVIMGNNDNCNGEPPVPVTPDRGRC